MGKKLRVYDRSAIGRHQLEDLTRCIEEVTEENYWHSHQCPRKRGYGPNKGYCKQHARMIEIGRLRVRDD